ncbi:glycosyltransferase [Sphingomonas sp.]|uniref:glycosyltransferase n=1 Tax=Sphingomonas sp. TaxID=28214 RepID=UPI003CC58866
MKIVVSAVNFTEGGPLTVLRECLAAGRQLFGSEVELIALVHSADLVAIKGVRTIEFRRAKSSWFRRVYLEYHYFRKLARQIRPDFWFSLHDVTPLLDDVPQAVYCHNPVPFFRPTLRDVWLDPTLLAFRFLYGLFYRFNIGSNRSVVVQQQWLRSAFERRYRAANVIVAHPGVADLHRASDKAAPSGKLILFYPTVPRGFKNVEVLCEAMALMPPTLTRSVELRITIVGTENRYARWLYRRYKGVAGISFVGRQDRVAMARHYADCGALVFPSRLETWGLPITEAKQAGKPMIVAEAPYAREAVGNHDRVQFTDPTNASAWARAIVAASEGSPGWGPAQYDVPAAPYAPDWTALWKMLVPEAVSMTE